MKPSLVIILVLSGIVGMLSSLYYLWCTVAVLASL